jgi:hypothetical protein
MSSDEDSSPQPQRTHAAGGPKHDDEDEFEFEQNFTDKKVKEENKQSRERGSRPHIPIAFQPLNSWCRAIRLSLQWARRANMSGC